MTVSCRNYSLVKRGWFVSAGFHYWCKMSLHGRADDTQYKTSHTEVFSRAGVGHHNSCYRDSPGLRECPDSISSLLFVVWPISWQFTEIFTYAIIWFASLRWALRKQQDDSSLASLSLKICCSNTVQH